VKKINRLVKRYRNIDKKTYRRFNLNNKNFIIVTEGGRMFGFGHITRCLSISSIFKKYGFNIQFIINGDDSLISMLSNTKYDIFNWTENKQKLLEILNDSSLILLDSIQITNEQILEIENLEKKVIFIDDEKRRNILNKGFVVDWTILSDKKEYFSPKKEDVTYLLGSKYTPLREEFMKVQKNIIKKEIQSILVTFGGSDVRDLTPKVLKTLRENFPDIIKNIVIGSGFTNIEKIKHYKDKNTNLILNADALTMSKLMQTSDIAIASGGQTLYELACIGTPTVSILLVNNAKDDTQGWDKVGTLINIGWYDDKNLLDKLTKTIFLLKDKNKRVQMQNRAKKYINSNGAKLLVETIIGKL